MITALCPIADKYVVLGSDDSVLTLVRFPEPDEPAHATSAVVSPTRPLFRLPVGPHPIKRLGKCSHHAVTSIDKLSYEINDTNAIVAAAAGNSLSIWDILSMQRVSTYSTRNNYFACSYLRPNLVAAAGDDRALSLYDTRLKSGARPLWSVHLASDNLYTIAKANDTVDEALGSIIYLAGANGAVYCVDVRKGTLDIWDLPQECEPAKTTMKKDPTNPVSQLRQNAILDLSYSAGHLIAVRERGDVCGFSVESQGANAALEDRQEFSFARKVSDGFDIRVSCDTVSERGKMYIAVGGSAGEITTLTVDESQNSILSESRIEVALSRNTAVPVVLWASNGGIYCGAGDQAVLMPFDSLHSY